MTKKPAKGKSARSSASSKRVRFRFGRLKVIPIDMKMVYAAYE